ncbi:hypothetical protein CKA32_004833 [Geitlerinema sp. FC II]|nr:hypothetical protein CKA32_004833 [Geitlerinema sp. FC II]
MDLSRSVSHRERRSNRVFSCILLQSLDIVRCSPLDFKI